jgi:two-component system, chemotaxis family, protein-glutamate methylesterase/glutaminase
LFLYLHKPNALAHTTLNTAANAALPDFGYDYHLIGLGSSTGGLQPLKTIISGLPSNLRAAVIVVHHAPEDAPHELAQILQGVADLPVIEVETAQRILPGHIYLPAFGQPVRLRDHILTVEGRPSGRKPHRTIDSCFHSLAREGGAKSICVILSGSGYDGVEGAKAVESNGGLVIVQDPATAKFPLMPIALIANDDPSYILEPQQISDRIARHVGR